MSNTPRLTPIKRRILRSLEADPASVWISRPIKANSVPIARWRDGGDLRSPTSTVAQLIAAGWIARGPMPARVTAPIPLQITEAGRRVLAGQGEAGND